jgi:beta-lactamase superfamily II metal-dependent hydrolase
MTLPTLLSTAIHASLIASLPTTLPIGPPAGPGLQFIDVGQGSALLIRDAAGELILIDSGPAGGAEAVLAAIAAEPDASLRLAIHSHYDADHLGGYARVVAGLDGVWPSADDLEIAQLWDRGLLGSIPDTDAAGLYFALAGANREQPEPGTVFVGDAVTITVLDLDPPPADAPENARGLALCVEVDGLVALLPGDLPADRFELAAAACGPVDVLWLPHHGSADAVSSMAISLADPELVVISAGLHNSYCHPSALALAAVHTRPTWILAAAGLDPSGSCPPLADALGPEHRLLGANLWIAADRQAWAGSAATTWSPTSRDRRDRSRIDARGWGEGPRPRAD